eukprot:CAMPEP_0196825486 /NCGR_PEP_ID=MMETSP1362-20130617/93084_1 /TAXON_ID=163516 /ORGANISM="Leptocylindrus danicus, Strain CCMP1856" /LENGTH=423 /DNA_ID=CAMNT_0042205923 /DNA_START=583 /DNA_END=1851 /DNA_ORIENTATION=-
MTTMVRRAGLSYDILQLVGFIFAFSVIYFFETEQGDLRADGGTVGILTKEQDNAASFAVKSDNINVSSPSAYDDVPVPDKQEQRTKPILLLHLGPIKTGSSSLQVYFKKEKHLLEKDGYHYDRNFRKFVDTKECFFVPNCDVEKIAQDKDWGKFVASLRSGMNVIASNEVFARRFADEPAHWDFLKREFNSFDVKIVLVYRRYFEWIPSFYYEQFKMSRNRLKVNGGWDKKMPIFVDWYRDYRKRIEPTVHHPAEYNMIKWGRHFPDISIFNLHNNPDDMVGDFFCNVIPNATNACLHRLEKGMENSFHVGKSLNYDILAVRAYEDGLLNHVNMTREEVSNAIRHRQEHDLNLSAIEFPLICLSPKEEEDLLGASLGYELKLQPDWYASSKGEIEHRAKFSDAVQERKFCSVNSTAVMLDTGW